MKVDFSKSADGLVPVIVQDSTSRVVLMLGYMNQAALNKTEELGKITFYSRSKERLWTKGEESGNFLEVVDIKVDCDQDSLLIQAKPFGPTCHKGTDTCWGEDNEDQYGFISHLEQIIQSRVEDSDSSKSYVASLFEKGINKVAQKVGEEAVEVVIEAMDNNDKLFKEESADLLFHYLMLLQAKGYRLKDIVAVLKTRH